MRHIKRMPGTSVCKASPSREAGEPDLAPTPEALRGATPHTPTFHSGKTDTLSDIMAILIPQLIRFAFGSSAWGQGSSSMASTTSAPGLGRSTREQTQPARGAAGHDMAEKV